MGYRRAWLKMTKPCTLAQRLQLNTHRELWTFGPHSRAALRFRCRTQSADLTSDGGFVSGGWTFEFNNQNEAYIVKTDSVGKVNKCSDVQVTTATTASVSETSFSASFQLACLPLWRAQARSQHRLPPLPSRRSVRSELGSLMLEVSRVSSPIETAAWLSARSLRFCLFDMVPNDRIRPHR